MANLSIKLILVVVFFAACVSTTYASTVSTTGPITRISPPTSVLEGALESDTTIYIFSERLALTLSEELAVNIISPNTYTGNLSPNGFIRDGINIHSYMVHMDHVGISGSRVFEGSISFPQRILGIITDDVTLDSSDPIVGLPSVTYPTSMSNVERGTLDNFDLGDTIIYSVDGKRVSFHVTNNGGNIEQFRIITFAPEPASGVMLALSGLAITRRHRVF